MDGNLTRLFAACLGVCLCVVVLTGWRLPTEGSPPGLDLRLIAVPPGELVVEPTGVVASGQAMQAGGPPIEGEMRVENLAGRALAVDLAVLPSSNDLAGKVRLQALAGGKTIAFGAPYERAPRPRPVLRLPPQGSARIEVSAWIPPGTAGYRGGILDLTLDVRASPRGTYR